MTNEIAKKPPPSYSSQNNSTAQTQTNPANPGGTRETPNGNYPGTLTRVDQITIKAELSTSLQKFIHHCNLNNKGYVTLSKLDSFAKKYPKEAETVKLAIEAKLNISIDNLDAKSFQRAVIQFQVDQYNRFGYLLGSGNIGDIAKADGLLGIKTFSAMVDDTPGITDSLIAHEDIPKDTQETANTYTVEEAQQNLLSTPSHIIKVNDIKETRSRLKLDAIVRSQLKSIKKVHLQRIFRSVSTILPGCTDLIQNLDNLISILGNKSIADLSLENQEKAIEILSTFYAALIETESSGGHDTSITSFAGALGITQGMPESFGLALAQGWSPAGIPEEKQAEILALSINIVKLDQYTNLTTVSYPCIAEFRHNIDTGSKIFPNQKVQLFINNKEELKEFQKLLKTQDRIDQKTIVAQQKKSEYFSLLTQKETNLSFGLFFLINNKDFNIKAYNGSGLAAERYQNGIYYAAATALQSTQA